MTIAGKPSGLRKGSTASTRKFSYQSFSQKIASLKIDPVRRVRHYVDDEETTKSFFKSSLDNWSERNLSATFASFVREIKPLCECLPLILHHQDAVFEMLHSYIKKHDAHALKPLLDLLAQFAHDLGANFEPYLSRAVALLVGIVTKHVEAETIEWAFNCLAYLLKYLSRLLVPDLRPLYDILAPLLGRENQKSFVTRFSAEALSFLVRKAKGESLELIVQHCLVDLQNTAGTAEAHAYPYGLMSMFYEAAISVDRTIHSRGPQLFGAMMNTASDQPDSDGVCAEVVLGVLTRLIHHTAPETFQPILDVVLKFIHADLNSGALNTQKTSMAAKLLYICVSVRKGRRVQNWIAVSDAGAEIVARAYKLPPGQAGSKETMWHALKAVAIVLQTAGTDVIILKCNRIVQKAKDFQSGILFLPFCEFVAGLGQYRFRTFLAPYLHKFILSQWNSQEHMLALVVPKLVSAGALQLSSDNDPLSEGLDSSSQVSMEIIGAFSKLELALKPADYGWDQLEPIAVIAWRYFDVVSSLLPACKPRFKDILYEHISSLVLAMATRCEVHGLATLIGKALGILSHMTPSAQIPRTGVSSTKLCDFIAAYGQNPAFLKGLVDYLKGVGVKTVNKEEIQRMTDISIQLLTSPGDEVRYLILSLLELLSQETMPSDIIRTAKMIEEIPFTLSNQRNVAMYVRKLGVDYSQAESNSWGRRMIPYYCFGLMTVKFAPLWEEASNILKIISESNDEIVAELAFKWISGEEFKDEDTPCVRDSPSPSTLGPFECSNYRFLEQLAEQCTLDDFSANVQIRAMFSTDSHLSNLSASRARTQALYVLCVIPQVAEKRSRLLVPMFLEWTRATSCEDVEDDDEQELPDFHAQPKWSHKNSAEMLTLFSKFINPRVLYKADAVYSALLKLLASGDGKIQSLALNCILTWKMPAIKGYEDQLTNLLDDTRFRDELTNFVQLGEDESSIQANHRALLMPVLLRILYGRSLSRKRASSGKKGMSSTRTAILSSLTNFQPEDRALFIDVALAEISEVEFVDKHDPNEFQFQMDALGSIHFSLRKQVGLVRMFEDLFKQLGTSLLVNMPKMLDALLYCMVSSIKAIDAENKVSEADDTVTLKALKAIRQGGFKCLNSMFRYCPNFQWKPYLPAIFGILINPKLKKISIETSQSVSSILHLFSTWASSKHLILLLAEYNNQILSKIAECLSNEKIKDEVVLFIVQLIQRIVQHVDNTEELETASAVKGLLLQPNIDGFLSRFGPILRKSVGKEVLEQIIETIAMLASHVSGNSETTQLVDISVFLLDQPSRRVNPKVKSDILRILVSFLPLCALEKGGELHNRAFRTISSLFGFFRDRTSRETLANVLKVFAKRDGDIAEVAELSRKLNSFSVKWLQEPDFEQRLEAYGIINEQRYMHFTPKQWAPLIYNMLFFIRDNEELAIRTNATYALNRFAEVCGSKIGGGDENEFVGLLSDIVLPALRAGAREQSEIIRVEYLAVMAHVIKKCPTLDGVRDMSPLLMGDDEEASFFNNILHIQQHRRGKALRRLAELSIKNNVQSSNIAHFLLPLVEHFVFDQVEGEHNLANDAVITIGALCEQLEWTQYRAILTRFVGYIKTKPDLEKIVIRLIGTAVNAIDNAWKIRSRLVEFPLDANGDVGMDPNSVVSSVIHYRLAESLPEQEKLSVEISNKFLSRLSEYLHKREETTVALRVPVAVSIVKLLRTMPEEMMKAKLPAVLTDVCHILRSRAQDSRDMTRKTLAEIALLLGPEFFSFILKELRGALLRGYQLHVLSFTVHSILLAVTPKFPPGSLDYCTQTLADIIMDDIFGVTGSEKDAEGYINKMKEVKSSKSYDSMDVLATITTHNFLGNLVRPIQALLLEKLNPKIVKKIDELLRRITTGLQKNELVKDRNLLVFCYEVIQEVFRTQSTIPTSDIVEESQKRFIVNLKVPSKNQSAVATTSHVSKLIKFALDIVRNVLGKRDDLMTPENLAGFIPIIGDAVLSNNEEVQISALRLLTTIIRVPLSEIDDGAEVFLTKAVSFIKSCPSTNAEIAQASLKLISALIRERKKPPIKETAVGYLLTKIKPDLEEPDRQGVTFNFIKSVMARKMVIPEVYDVMDQIAVIMVTNQTRTVRDFARGLYFQFLMDFPQGQGRLKNQLEFLIKNLEYPHESGRKSVLDTVHLVITKIGDNLIQQPVGMFFVPLVMVLVNDDSAECREMTGTLLKEVITRADSEHRRTFLKLLRAWVDQDQQPLLLRVALQVYGLYFDVIGINGKNEIALLVRRLRELLSNVLDEATEDSIKWELIYFGLQLWFKMAKLFPDSILSASSSDTWKAVQGCLGYRHAWIRLTSSRLLGSLFSQMTTSPLSAIPIINSRGLELQGVDMINIARATSAQLNSPELTDDLGLQVVKNLLFLGRCFYANKMPAPQKGSEGEDEDKEAETKTALLWIIGRISGVIRSERNLQRGVLAKNIGKKYALQWLAAMTQVIESDYLIQIATVVITPLYNLVELPDASETKDLKSTSLEILSMLQTKIGTTEYVKAYTTVRQFVQERRMERKQKRAIELVAEPEVAAKRKSRKNERKKTVRKEKVSKHREYRRGKVL